jgi:hypothetical protein
MEQSVEAAERSMSLKGCRYLGRATAPPRDDARNRPPIGPFMTARRHEPLCVFLGVPAPAQSYTSRNTTSEFRAHLR